MRGNKIAEMTKNLNNNVRLKIISENVKSVRIENGNNSSSKLTPIILSLPITFDGWSEESCDRLRALLETVLSSNPSFSSFWILYIHLECFLSRFLEAKKVFFRAINVVGFCKNIWILLFGVLRPAFTEREIEDLKNVIIEDKNIFLRVI
jgi:hypothetical protein